MIVIGVPLPPLKVRFAAVGGKATPLLLHLTKALPEMVVRKVAKLPFAGGALAKLAWVVYVPALRITVLPLVAPG